MDIADYGSRMNQTKEDLTDKRQRPPYAVDYDGRVQESDLITRTEAAELMGVSSRTVTRYALNGYLTKYTDSRGRIRFSRIEAGAMNRFEPEGDL